MKNTALLGFVAVLVAGCPSMMVVDGISVRQDDWLEAEAAVSARAKADFGCEDVKLTLKKVHPAASPTQVDAAGCGKTGTYVQGEAGWRAQTAP